jgi:CRP/FNR family transcriptional regulator, cyclic AMP receptor protein
VLLAADGTAALAGVVGRGELIGESGVLHQTARSAQVTAVTGGAVTVLGRAEFLGLFDRHAAVRDLVVAAARVRQERSDSRHLLLARDVPSRVAATLLDWARAHGVAVRQGLRVSGPTQRDVAMAVAASEKSVEAVYGRLRAAGLLISGRRTFLLPDPGAIAEIAAGNRAPIPDMRG